MPIISLTGTNKGLPLNEGGLIDLVCVPISGVPLPTVTFRGPNGGQLPPGATVATRGNGSVLSIPGVSSYTCVECVGTNSEGAVTERLCFNVLGKTRAAPERILQWCVLHCALLGVFCVCSSIFDLATSTEIYGHSIQWTPGWLNEYLSR